jgi:hypothetical protein
VGQVGRQVGDRKEAHTHPHGNKGKNHLLNSLYNLPVFHPLR